MSVTYLYSTYCMISTTSRIYYIHQASHQRWWPPSRASPRLDRRPGPSSIDLLTLFPPEGLCPFASRLPSPGKSDFETAPFQLKCCLSAPVCGRRETHLNPITSNCFNWSQVWNVLSKKSPSVQQLTEMFGCEQVSRATSNPNYSTNAQSNHMLYTYTPHRHVLSSLSVVISCDTLDVLV